MPMFFLVDTRRMLGVISLSGPPCRFISFLPRRTPVKLYLTVQQSLVRAHMGLHYILAACHCHLG